MAAGTSLQVSCEGTSLTTTSTSATTVDLNCLTKAPAVPVAVGHATTFASGDSGSPTTALPAGATTGDVLVSYVESYSFTTINCRQGWTKVFDTTSSGGTRLIACTTVVQANQANPQAVVSPPTQVSMVTMAFSGVSSTDPVDASAASSGSVSPSVTTDTAGTLLVLGEGSDAWQVVAQAPPGATLGATLNDSGNSQAADATANVNTSGPTVAVTWPHLAPSSSVSGTIALRPAAASSSVNSPSDTDTPTQQMAANTALTVSCTGSSLTVTGTGPTSVILQCLAAQAIAQVGQATMNASGSAGSLSTTLPSGLRPGDVLVSYVESYSFTSVSCDSGWTETLDAANASGARLAACVTVATVGQVEPQVRINPATQVSMVTEAFSGVSSSDPVAASAVKAGSVSPSVLTQTPGTMLVLGEGSNAWKLVVNAPPGAVLGASENNSGNSQAAVANDSNSDANPSSPAQWSPNVPQSSPVSATIALTPASGGGGGTTTTTTTTDPTTTTTHPTTTTTNPTTTTTNPTTTTTNPTTTTTSSGGGGGAPPTPPVEICGNESVLAGPSSPPAGAVTVPAGNNAGLSLDQANTTYWFAPGTHTLGSGEYSQIIPSDGDTYIGGPGAIIDGQNLNNFAFTQQATNVTIEYLTIEDFGQTGGNQNEFVVNHDSGSGWTVKYNTIQDNAGAGLGLGSNSVTEYNCLTKNGQYGFSSYAPAGIQNVTLDYNEISYNDTYNWEVKSPGCGCSGGGKFWNGYNISVRDNYVHDNENVGLWADTDNSGITVEGNYISKNFAEAVMIEISYNFLIADNTIVDNDWGNGAQLGGGFPGTAIYISESGYDSRAPDPVGTSAEITGNVLTDNWGGVVLWENSNRFCGQDSPDNAGSLCTLVAPSVATTSTCVTPGINTDPLFSDCRWKTQNVDVTDNTFAFQPADIGSDCTPSNGCGFVGLFSEYGSTSPYKAWVVPKDIADNQNNHFSDNTYTGPWSFMGPDQGVTATWAQWTGGYTDNADGSGIYLDPQDAGSTLNR
jgi:hypothetical protein